MPDSLPSTPPSAYAFGSFTLDRKRRQLMSGGVPVKLQSRAFDMLECLIERRHRPVGRDEIMTQVWRGQAVAETNLTVQMSNLRRVLDEHGGNNLIVTVNRSYQFVGDVTEILPAAPPAPTPPAAPPAVVVPVAPLPLQPKRPGWRLPLLFGLCGLMLALAGLAAWHALTAPAPPRLSLAVLPFRYLGASHDQAYLAEAIDDDLNADLSHIPGSIIIAHDSTAAYAGKDVPPTRIGRALNVRYLVSGTIFIDGGNAHINAELIDASRGSTLWSDRFDKPVANLSEARDAIVYRIASALNIALDALEASRSEHDRPDNPDAQDLLFRARAILDAGDSLDNFRKAQALLKQALAQQPDFGDAQAELAWLMVRKVLAFDEDGDWEEATRAIDRGLQLVPNNVKALAARGRELMIEGRYKEAESTALAALQIEPSSLEAEWVVANCAWYLGELEREDKALQQIAQLDPADSKEGKHVAVLRGMLAVLLGRPHDAIGLLYAAVSGDPQQKVDNLAIDRSVLARLMLVAAYSLSGEQDKALQSYRDFSSVWPNRSVWRLAADLPKAVAHFSGAAEAFKALERSGMPRYSPPVRVEAATKDTCGEGDYRPTPTNLVGGRVADTQDVQRLLAKQPPPLVIDLGKGAGVVPGAVWLDPARAYVSSNAFIDGVISDHFDREPVIVMGDGWTGCDAYNAALYIVQKYKRNVVWFRGGEEAWAQAGLSATDRRN